MPACRAIRLARGLATTRSLSPAAAGSESDLLPDLVSGLDSGFSAFPASFGPALSSEAPESSASPFLAAFFPLPAESPASFRAESSSPSSSRMAMGALTATPSVPPGTRILPRVPSSIASTSMVALSVSISAITSPAAMASPSFLSQRARVPSDMVGDRAGMVISMVMVSVSAASV
jgi:hypothetical protein